MEVAKDTVQKEEISESINLEEAAYYNNRELSWLAFNERVLEEAIDVNNPLLERMKFMAIFSSNLDEFFMVRVAGLKDQVKAGFNKPENKAGMTPREQLERISKKTHKLTERQEQELHKELLPMLKEEGISLLSYEKLSKEQKDFVTKMFNDRIFPVLTPLAIDAYRPFPKLINKSLNLGVLLQDPDQDEYKEDVLAIVQVPTVLKRFYLVTIEKKSKTVYLA